MNINEYVAKAIHLGESEMPRIPFDQAAALVVRYGFPEPQYGTNIIVAPRGHEFNGIDNALERLRDFTVSLIETVINDCISVVSEIGTISDDDRKKVIDTIRARYTKTETESYEW